MGLETVLQQPPAIVARAENTADWMQLPGIEEFAAGLKETVRNAREKNALGRVLSWEIIRQCWEYGNRPEVRARVAVLNCLPDGRPKPGRSYTGHRLALQALVARCGMTERTAYRWDAELAHICRLSKINPNELIDMCQSTPDKVADRLDEIDALVEAAEATSSVAMDCNQEAQALENQLPLEALGERLGQSFLHKARLDKSLNPPVLRGLLKALCPVFERHGYTVMLRKRSSN